MLYAVICRDRPGAAAIRAANRDAHIAFLKKSGDMIRLAGPFLDESGESMTGSLLIVEAEDIATVHAWAGQDPYKQADLFESVDIRPWKYVLGDGVK